MFSELECAVCYLTYNAGQRCPRELRCKHTFCESCLLALSQDLALSRALGPTERAIVCPLCRHTTHISAEDRIRAELRVDECALERLLVTGLLLEDPEDRPQGPEEGPQGPEEGPVEGSQGTEEESAAGHSDLSGGVSRGRFRRTMRKVWKKIKRTNERHTAINNLTDLSSDDMRDFSMMAWYMC